MSLDRSLRSANSLVRHRNVLTRAERMVQLKDEEKWDENKSVFGLPKVAHRKQEIGGKVKEEAVEGEAAAGATPAAGAPAAPGAKTAAAPAAKGAPAAKAGPAAKAAPAKGKK